MEHLSPRGAPSGIFIGRHSSFDVGNVEGFQCLKTPCSSVPIDYKRAEVVTNRAFTEKILFKIQNFQQLFN